jgi:beta-galactosidase
MRPSILTSFVALLVVAGGGGLACTGAERSAASTPAPAPAANALPPPPEVGPPARTGRFDAFLFGVCYYPEQWPRDYWPRDARRMREAGVNVVRVGEFAWAALEPEEGRFDFRWLDDAVAVLAKEQIKVVLGTPTAAPPKWLTHKYPDVLHVHETGRPADDQSRRHYCYNSPRYRALCRRVVEATAAHFERSTDVVGWQVDNEMNNENGPCHSDACRAAFRGWLTAKYGSLDALNARWGTAFWSQTYTAWDQIGLPGPTLAYHNPGLVLDHRRFASDSATSFLEDQVAVLRRHRPADFVTHNGVFRGVDYYKFARSLDLYAQDSYPTFLDQPRFPTAALLTAARSFAGRMMVMEEMTGPAGQTYLLRTPAPGQMKFWAVQTVAHGADGVVHFRWRSARRGAEQYWSGVLDHDDVPRGRYAEFAEEGRDLAKIGREVLGAEVRSDVAVVNDYDNEWAYDHQFLTAEVNRDAGVHMRADLVDLFRAASERGFNLDFVPPSADLTRYRLVVAPRPTLADAGLADRLRRCAEAGGTVVVCGHAGVKDRDNAMPGTTPPGVFADLCGVEVESFQCYGPPSAGKNALAFGGGAAVPVHVMADVLEPRAGGGAVVAATWARDHFAGAAACTERAVGRGKAVYYGSFVDLPAARHLVGRYAAAAGAEPLLTDLPDGVEVTRRSKGDARWYFLLNHGDAAATVDLGGRRFADVLTGEPVAGKVGLDGFRYRVLRRLDD